MTEYRTIPEAHISAFSNLNNVVRFDAERIKDHLNRTVPRTVEETLNSLLNAEADRLVDAERCA